jgi:hypothetical protein
LEQFVAVREKGKEKEMEMAAVSDRSVTMACRFRCHAVY